jgi:DNA-binding CsgD family transcriptional regulator
MAKTITDTSRRQYTWSEEELDYLYDNWGLLSTSTIAKNLKRTTGAIQHKAVEFGLGRHLESSGFVSLRTVLCEFGLEETYKWYAKKLIDAGLPTHKQRVNKQSFCVIDLNEFWGFMEHHQDLLSFANLGLNALGKEPDWAKKKRREDYQKALKISQNNVRWTKKEDKQLLQLLKAGYNYIEIGQRMGRKPGGVRFRAYELKKDGSNTISLANRWTEEEKNTLLKFIEAEKSLSEIAELMGKTRSSIKTKVYSIFKTYSAVEARQVLLSP